jgi:hypothetical protein
MDRMKKAMSAAAMSDELKDKLVSVHRSSFIAPRFLHPVHHLFEFSHIAV